MSERPQIEKALKNVTNKYELVHAALLRTKQLIEKGDDFFIKTKRGLIKKTFQAINDIADKKVSIKRIDQNEQNEKHPE